MANPSSTNCKFCSAVIPFDTVRNSIAICSACGNANKIKVPMSRTAKLAIAGSVFLTLAALGAVFKNEIAFEVSPAYAIGKMPAAQVSQLKQKCLIENDHECLVHVFERQTELNPQDINSKANWAFQLTALNRFSDADPIYKEVLADGFGTYDLMAFYGLNFEGLNQNKDAIKWLEKSFEINPRDVGVAKSLAKIYVKEKRPVEAVSLLKSFSQMFPEAEGMLAGHISASLELFENSPTSDTIRLVGLSRGHFGLPLKLGKENKSEAYMVDTGATLVSLPTSDIEKYTPNLLTKATRAKAFIANGQSIEIRLVKIPKIVIGGWEFKNVEAGFCDTCARLAGMSLLKQLKITTEAKGELGTMTLTKLK